MINIIASNPSAYTATGLPYTNETFPTSTAAQKSAAAADRRLSNAFINESYLGSGNSLNGNPTNCSNGYIFTNVTMVRVQPLSGEISKLTIKVSDQTSGVKDITQGFKISSKGLFSNSLDKTTRTVEAYKYLDTPSSIYDYAVFLDN